MTTIQGRKNVPSQITLLDLQGKIGGCLTGKQENRDSFYDNIWQPTAVLGCVKISEVSRM